MTCLPVENRQRVAGIGIPVEQDIVRPRRPCDLEDALEDRIHHPIEIGMIELRVAAAWAAGVAPAAPTAAACVVDAVPLVVAGASVNAVSWLVAASADAT